LRGERADHCCFQSTRREELCQTCVSGFAPGVSRVFRETWDADFAWFEEEKARGSTPFGGGLLGKDLCLDDVVHVVSVSCDFMIPEPMC
jgi:hypothetical protein